MDRDKDRRNYDTDRDRRDRRNYDMDVNVSVSRERRNYDMERDRRNYDTGRDRRNYDTERDRRNYDMDRSYGYGHGPGPGPFRGNGDGAYFDEPSFGMYNQPRRGPGYQGVPKQRLTRNQREHLNAYLEEWRIMDPPAYRIWYRAHKKHTENPERYGPPLVPGYPPHEEALKQQQHYPPQYSQAGERTMTPMHFPQPYQYPYDSDYDRGIAVPSGSSSVNGSIFNPSEYEETESVYENGKFENETETETSQDKDRLTPLKFLSGHSIGVITPFGHLVRVAGGSRTVKIFHVKTLMKDLPEYHELEAFPGPLVRGRTHKNTVIKFCQKKIKSIQNQEFQTDKENLILLWELLILLIRQNGNVVGSDIAELLLKKKGKLEAGIGVENELNSKHSEVEDEGNDVVGDSGVSTVNDVAPVPNDAKITQGFCDLLLFGHKNDALDFAMENGLWGHALFLASKMGDREYGQVMTKFANGLLYNHPLQTLYQVMSGRVPSSVTGCLDDSFGDWRPHLAMIVSNAGIRPEVEQKAFVSLGDTLRNKNLIFAGQFCHLMAHSTFSEDSKLGPLLGLSPNSTNILEATQMTEIYEFATSGDPNYNLGLSFLQSKFNYVKCLIDFGFTSQAYSYCEVIAKQLKPLGNKDKEDSLRWNIMQVADRLKYVDEGSNSDWIQDLRNSLFETQTNTNTSEASSRRASSTEMSSAPDHDTSTNIYTSGGVVEATNVGGNDGYKPGESRQSDPFNNKIPDTAGANEPNSTQYVPSIPMIPTFNPAQHSNQPDFEQNNQNTGYSSGSGVPAQGWNSNPNQPGFEQNNQNKGYSSGSGVPAQAWNSNPNQPGSEYNNQIPGYANGVPAWDPNAPTWADSQPRSTNGPFQQPTPDDPKHGFFQPGQKPADVNANNYYHPSFSGTLGNGPSHVQPSNYPQAQPSYNSQPTNPTPVTKRKTVRFEDDEGEGGVGGVRMSRSKALDILKRGESEDGTETTSEEEEFGNHPVQFKSTFPIDAPFARRVFSPPSTLSLRTSKVNSVRTYPVDRKCCEFSTPCRDHSPALSSPSAAPNHLAQGQQKVEDKKKKDGKGGDGKESKSKPAGPGWLKWLGFGPKNPMILPDDKKKAIVWDEDKDAWVNTEADEEDSSKPPPAPPRDSDLMRPSGQPQPPMGFAPPQHQQQQPMNYGQPPQPMNYGQPPPPQPMNYGQPPQSMADAPPAFNPILQQPVTQQENWGNQPASLGPTSLNYNQNQHPIQPLGPQSLNLQQPFNPQQQPPAPTPMNMNKYQLPKSNARSGMRGKYVDVLNPGGSSSGPQPGLAPPSMAPVVAQSNGPTFAPGPTTNSDEFHQHRQ